MSTYVVAASKPWFLKHAKSAAYRALRILEITQKEDLTLDKLAQYNPRYIFFPHWSWVVPAEIFDRYECVVFHTAPLPSGRGGSPIQNLIQRGYQTSPVCALRMTQELDAGPIYASKDVSLAGTIDEIFARIAPVVEELLLKIISEKPIPQPQPGAKVEVFKRRTPEQSRLPQTSSLAELYDLIRMVDGADYPRAFIEYGEFRLEFSSAELSGTNSNELQAQVRITRRRE